MLVCAVSPGPQPSARTLGAQVHRDGYAYIGCVMTEPVRGAGGGGDDDPAAAAGDGSAAFGTRGGGLHSGSQLRLRLQLRAAACVRAYTCCRSPLSFACTCYTCSMRIINYSSMSIWGVHGTPLAPAGCQAAGGLLLLPGLAGHAGHVPARGGEPTTRLRPDRPSPSPPCPHVGPALRAALRGLGLPLLPVP